MIATAKFKYQFIALVLFIATVTSGCDNLSEIVEDDKAGLNGSFEVAQNGLPVNWHMYTPNTVPNADFQIILDKETYKEGKQSLQFIVKRSDLRGGWKTPGFTNEFTNVGKFKGENRYKLSFWIKNNGAEFSISAGGVSSKSGNMITLLKTNERFEDWKQFEYEINVSKDNWLRMQLSVFKPGVFWIDDVRVEKL